VRSGDSLRLRATGLETRRSRSKPDRGLIRTQSELINQNDEVVLRVTAMNIIRARNPA
jgi:acyl dehydratase